MRMNVGVYFCKWLVIFYIPYIYAKRTNNILKHDTSTTVYVQLTCMLSNTRNKYSIINRTRNKKKKMFATQEENHCKK